MANQHKFKVEKPSYRLRLLTSTYLKGEGIRVVPSLLQQHLVHAVLGRLVALRVDLDMLDPDVLPEAEAHHVQVIAAIAEGARQLHIHWPETKLVILPSHNNISEATAASPTFPVSKVFCVQLDDAIC